MKIYIVTKGNKYFYIIGGLLDNIITEQAKSSVVNDVLCFNKTISQSCNTDETYIKCLGCTDEKL